MTQHTNALNILALAAEKYVAGLDELASALVGEQVQTGKQMLSNLIAEYHSQQVQIQELHRQLSEPRTPDQVPLFEEVEE